jgi:type III restriction enzyme
MSVEFRISEQLLRVNDADEATQALVHKYDAFLNLLSSGRFDFQPAAIRESLKFLVSAKYPDLESLTRDSWINNPALSKRHDSIDALLARMPLKDRKAASLDLATGTGKSYVMYGIAAIALAEGLVDRVLVLCPSLTIEDGLLEKFTALAGDPVLTEMMKSLGAKVAIPGVKRGTETIHPGDICIENIHAVYGNAGSSIADSFKGRGGRTLVLNDEAHHIFSPDDSDDSATMKKWLEFLRNGEYGFRYLIHVSGTPYIENDYFPDVIFRFGLKNAVEAKVVKKPDYVVADMLKKQSWDKIHAVHLDNIKTHGRKLRPISIVVTQEIAKCVEVWKELVAYLVKKEKITREAAEQKVIWVTSGVPSSGAAKARVLAACPPRDKKDSPDKRRKENLEALKQVDSPDSKVEWIVSVSMLTEGWDVKNVFQIVPHESRAFSSKLLIAQVLGRGLRMPPGFDSQPLVRVTNHEAWTSNIENLLKEILEIENTLSYGYDPRRKKYHFPLHNLRYELEQTSVESKKEKAKEIKLQLRPQARTSKAFTTFSTSGKLAAEITHDDTIEIEGAVKLLRRFIVDKDAELAKVWTKERLRKLIEDALERDGYEPGFLSRENLSLVQQALGPLFRGTDREHPRMGQVAKDLVELNFSDAGPQSFSESRLCEDGAVYRVNGDAAPVVGHDKVLWDQYCKWVKAIDAGLEDSMNDKAKEVAKRIHGVEESKFKTPVNLHYASHKPEQEFSDLLFENADLIESFIKVPDRGFYSFPYSYKPSNTGKTHTTNEQFNPDFFIKLKGKKDIVCVEIKKDGDDSNRNKAKYRDGLAHFENLNAALEKAKEGWRYHFKFLSPKDYTGFFGALKSGKIANWKSSLMQDLSE